MLFPVTDHVAKSARHTTFYLSCGPSDGPLIIFVHGWPELSLSWRHQLPCFAGLGFRAVAPDMRGYGRSSVYTRHEDYALEHIVDDMLELLAALGRDKAVWVGHDWGSPVVWSLASHHPDKCVGIANLCVPYFAKGFAPENFLPLVDRSIYPEAEFPAGQWEYQLFYEESFDKARQGFEADVRATVKALFRKGRPEMQGQAQPHRAGAQGRRLVRRHRQGPRPADRYRRADRSGPRRLRCRARGQRLLRPGLLVHEPPPQRRSSPPKPATAASSACRCCSCTAPTTTPARP